jgi:TRAP-type uncharacterized transport system fused permease subunit
MDNAQVDRVILFICSVIGFAALSAAIERYWSHRGWLVVLAATVVLTIICLLLGARDPEFENWRRRYRAKKKLEAEQLRLKPRAD